MAVCMKRLVPASAPELPRLRYEEVMALHTTWRVGGPADRWFQPQDIPALCDFLKELPAKEKLYWIGRGSNLLVRDGGLRGTVINTRDLKRLDFDSDTGTLEAEAGVPCPRVARGAARLGLAGVEFLAGVPGSLGGALAMNAGAHGDDLWTRVTEVRTVDRCGISRWCAATEFRAGYRSLRRVDAGDGPQWGPQWGLQWFLGARLLLEREPAARVRQRMLEQLRRRNAAQPLSLPNCGSVFRNPPGDHAARLIEECALKGTTEGGAQVSNRHANFIVNTGGATAADVEKLIERMRRRVLERTGVALETEVVILGEALSLPEQRR